MRRGLLAWHVREGNYGDVEPDRLNVVGVGLFEGNISTGEATKPAMRFYIDERADERQREALQTIRGGQAGAGRALIEDVSLFEIALHQFDITDDTAHWRWSLREGQRQRRGADPADRSGRSARAGPQRRRRGGRPRPRRHGATAKEDDVEASGFKWSWPRPLLQALPVGLVRTGRVLT